MRYYSTLRPIGPGTFPSGYKVKNVVNFDRRELCAEIGGRPAWGYIDFEGELSEKDARQYDLILPHVESPGCIRHVPSFQPADYDALDYAEGRCLGDDVD